MADPVIVREWLDKAEEVFLFAESNLVEGSEFFAQICFHFQQSAEKYLKAYIIAKDLPFEKVHDLVHLLRICSGHDPVLTLNPTPYTVNRKTQTANRVLKEQKNGTARPGPQCSSAKKKRYP